MNISNESEENDMYNADGTYNGFSNYETFYFYSESAYGFDLSDIVGDVEEWAEDFKEEYKD